MITLSLGHLTFAIGTLITTYMQLFLTVFPCVPKREMKQLQSTTPISKSPLTSICGVSVEDIETVVHAIKHHRPEDIPIDEYNETMRDLLKETGFTRRVIWSIFNEPVFRDNIDSRDSNERRRVRATLDYFSLMFKYRERLAGLHPDTCSLRHLQACILPFTVKAFIISKNTDWMSEEEINREMVTLVSSIDSYEAATRAINLKALRERGASEETVLHHDTMLSLPSDAFAYHMETCKCCNIHTLPPETSPHDARECETDHKRLKDLDRWYWIDEDDLELHSLPPQDRRSYRFPYPSSLKSCIDTLLSPHYMMEREFSDKRYSKLGYIILSEAAVQTRERNTSVTGFTSTASQAHS